MSSLELSEEFGFRQKTCWEFKWKIPQAMKNSLQYLSQGIIHVDEFYIGEEEGKPGKSNGSKKRLIIVALEILGDKGVGRAYALMI